MTLTSMTGFGEGEATILGRRTRVELRSINHRYLEVRCRLPRTLAALEQQVVGRIKGRILRGKVEVAVVPEEAADGEGLGAVVDHALARAYWTRIEELARSLGMGPQQPDLALLLGLPEVVRAEDPHYDTSEVGAQLEAALDLAIDRLCASRAAEGAALADDLRRRGQTLQESLEKVRARAPQVQRHHQQRLRERVARLLEQAGGTSRVDENRLAQELVLLADRLDVEEEMTRLDHHLRTLDGLLAGDGNGPQGRRLDFLVQELMREVNTIGSKANDALIADLVVGMKSELERIREQVQNLE